MSLTVACLLKKQSQLLTIMCVRHRSQRKNLGKPPGVAKTLEERLRGNNKNYSTNITHFKFIWITFGCFRNELQRSKNSF